MSTKEIKQEDPKKCFVGGLSWDTDVPSLRKAFEPFGEVLDAQVIRDRETGSSGFVTFATGEAMSSAIRDMDGSILGGRTIRVSEA